MEEVLVANPQQQIKVRNNWSKFTNEVFDKLTVITQRYQNNLEVQISGNATKLPIKKRHLEFLLNELVNNANKFSPKHTQIKIYFQNDENELKIRVADNGPGIPDDALPHIFEKFFKYPNDCNPTPVGAGLGLAIVEQITEKYGGKIQVNTLPGEGTEFVIWFSKRII